MKTQSKSDALSVPVHRLFRHWLRMGYGRICHAVWLPLPESIAMQSRLGAHLLGWAGYWANMTWSMPNDQAQPDAASSSARRYRVVPAFNIWTDGERFFPESRPKWWPFWFRFDDGNGSQISFLREESAQKFIDIAKINDR